MKKKAFSLPTPQGTSITQRLYRALLSAIPAALRTCYKLLCIIIPLSLVVRIAQQLGVLSFLSAYLDPLFRFIGLTGEASVVFITSIFMPLYAAIAVMSSLVLDMREVTIIALMCLVSHNLIVECAVQRATGSSFISLFALRIVISFAMGYLLNLLLPHTGYEPWLSTQTTVTEIGWGEMLQQWVFTTMVLAGTMLSIIIALLIMQKVLQEFKLLDLIARPFAPIVAMLGLPRSTSLLWIVGNTLGLTYGGAAMIELYNEGEISVADCKLLNIHLAISHSLLEDTLIFVALGVSGLLIITTRLLMAFVIVWAYRFILLLKIHSTKV